MILRLSMVTMIALWLTGCSFWGDKTKPGDGAYFEDDGPPAYAGPDPSSVPDAVPRNEALSKTGNAPYEVFGVRYVPLKSALGYQVKGTASWYGRKFHGRRTSSGETYDMYAMTAAHKTLPLPTYVRVKNLDNGTQVVLRVNDRGPFLGGRLIDLSYMAARKLGVTTSGTARVEVTAINDHSASVPVTDVSITQHSDRQVYAQAGSFRLIGNAHTLRERLTQQGIARVNVSPTRIDNTLYHRVWVGPLRSDQKLSEIIDEIARITGSEPHIVQDN